MENAVIEAPENPFAASAPARAAQSQSGAVAISQQRETAEVQAKMLMAERFPRNEVVAMDRILNAFTRPRLADQAQYQYSKGGSDVSGPSIRSAEAIAQLWGNMEFGFRELSRGRGDDGVTYSEIEAFAWDVQNRTRRPIVFQVRHWRDTKRGGYPLKDERDIYELMSNMAQRRVRACILAVVPGDVVEAAMAQAEVTLRAKADTSPEAMAKMVEAFGAFDVTKELLEKRIQRRLDAIQPAQVVSLKKIYASLRDGMSAPHDWFEIEAPAPEVPDTVASMNAQIGGRARPARNRQPSPQHSAGAPRAKEPAAPPQDDHPVVTYAMVRESLEKAATADAMDVAADTIGAIADEGQRAELVQLYREQQARFAE